MNKLLSFLLMLAVGAQGAGQVTDQATEGARPAHDYAKTPEALRPYHAVLEPYRWYFTTPPRLYGLSTGPTDPGTLSSIKLGLLAPLEGTNDLEAGRSLRDGAALAIDQQNAAGGYRGVPFELVLRNDLPKWGSSANTLVDLAYREHVWAVLGSVDSNSTHVALRVALKCEVPIVNVGASDPTITETGIPWIVRCTPDDRQVGYALAELLFADQPGRQVAVMRSSDRYGRMGIKEFQDAARRLGSPVPMEILFHPGAPDFDSQLDRVRRSGATDVVLWAKAEDAGRIVKRMRELGMQHPVYGPDRLVADSFLRTAGAAAEGVTAVSILDVGRSDEAWTAFASTFRERFGREPDAFAAYGYDAANLLVDALHSSGLDRVALRDELLRRRSGEGVTGRMEFDATSNNLGTLSIVHVQGGRFVRR